MLSDTRTSTLIDEFKWTLGNTELRYNYTYDALGNISEIKENNTTVASYTYDEQGQLLSETLPQENIKNVYVYDTYGNIRSVKKYDLTANTLLSEDAYGYSNASWLDRLTAFNGVTITYDDAGNPLSYYNGSAYTLTWQNGRELATATKNGVTSSYKYNIDGQRVQKTVGNVVYDYYYADGLLVRQTWGNNYIDFLYDESGVFSFVYNETQYFYIKNLQGDVVAIANAAGTILVEYIYDAWGDILSITGAEAATLGAVNPIRYRGYYFDTDTEFYYLNSRYYDPEIRRFINADSYINANGDFLGFNMYAYCGNNPVNRIDITGNACWHWVVGAAVVLGFAALTIATCGGSLAAAATAVGMVASGSMAFTTASTIAAAGFIGSATAYGAVAMSTALNSTSLDDFADKGNTGVIVSTAVGGIIGSGSAYISLHSQTNTSQSNSSQYISRGSSGRTEPYNLSEQLAMKQVKSNPYAGTQLTKITLNDPRWSSSDGWVKMQQIIHTSQGDINIHYVYNTILDVFDDFKFTS